MCMTQVKLIPSYPVVPPLSLPFINKERKGWGKGGWEGEQESGKMYYSANFFEELIA